MGARTSRIEGNQPNATVAGSVEDVQGVPLGALFGAQSLQGTFPVCAVILTASLPLGVWRIRGTPPEALGGATTAKAVRMSGR